MNAQQIEAIVIGGSSGALSALMPILSALPRDFFAPIAVVLHVAPSRPSLLADVLQGACQGSVKEAEDKEPFAPGVVYTAPPNYHLLVDRRGYLALSVDEPVYFSRPSIDVLFESAADAYGPALLGVLLSGGSHDGAHGIACIAAGGGTALVQTPATARVPTMPQAALGVARPEHVLAPAEIGAFIAHLRRPPAATSEVHER
jgi:two-component system chemotaxis response regulator CheB